MNKYAILQVLLLLYLVAILPAARAVALETVDFSIDRAVKATDYYTAEVKPGDRKMFRYHVRNNKPKPAELEIYASDVLTGVNGGEARIRSTDPPKLRALWVEEKPVSFVLPPGETREFDFHVRVPDTVQDGQYYISIVLSESLPGVPVSARKGLPIELNINKTAAAHQLEISDFFYEVASDGSYLFFPVIQNTGTILERPEVGLRIFSGRKVFVDQTIQLGSVFESTEGRARFQSAESLDTGDYMAHVRARYGDKLVERDFQFRVTKETVQTAKEGRNVAQNAVLESGSVPLIDGPRWLGMKRETAEGLLLGAVIGLLFLLFRRRRKQQTEEARKNV